MMIYNDVSMDVCYDASTREIIVTYVNRGVTDLIDISEMSVDPYYARVNLTCILAKPIGRKMAQSHPLAYTLKTLILPAGKAVAYRTNIVNLFHQCDCDYFFESKHAFLVAAVGFQCQLGVIFLTASTNISL